MKDRSAEKAEFGLDEPADDDLGENDDRIEEPSSKEEETARSSLYASQRNTLTAITAVTPLAFSKTHNQGTNK